MHDASGENRRPRGPLESVEALRGECERATKALAEATEEDFARPTCCTAWNVKELLAHLYRAIGRIETGLAEPAPDAPDTTAVTYWRASAPDDDAADIADRAKQLAAEYPLGVDLLDAWTEKWRRVCDAAAAADALRPVKTWGPTLTLDDLVKTRVLEAAVHGLDLAAALERPAWSTEEGLAVTRQILVGLLGFEPPAELGWDDVALIEAGAGRRGLAEEERRILGPAADRFPLLG